MHNTIFFVCATNHKKGFSYFTIHQYCNRIFLCIIHLLYKTAIISVTRSQYTGKIMNKDQFQKLPTIRTAGLQPTIPVVNFARIPGQARIIYMINFYSPTGTKLCQEAKRKISDNPLRIH